MLIKSWNIVMIKQQWASPSSILLATTLFALLLATLVVWTSTERNWYGMTLVTSDEGQVQLIKLNNPAVKNTLKLPVSVLAIGKNNNRLDIKSNDIIEEPDVFDSYTELDEFRLRQEVLYQQMQNGTLTLTLLDAAGQQQQLVLPARSSHPLNSLALPFWIQLITGIGGFIIGSWVLALRPRDPAAYCFMLTGAALMLAAFPAAIYSTRELALPATLMQSLMTLNHSGSVGFGFALMALFLYFPQRLVSLRWAALTFICYLIWLLIEVNEASSSSLAIMYLPILALSGLILLLIALQWWHSRGKPQALAALRWLGFITFITICCFLLLAAIPALFKQMPAVSQGSAFGFFLILYAGLALGLKRYRLFDLDRWAFHILLWVLAGTALVIVDVILLTFMHWQQKTSLLVSILLCGFLYLPLRGWLWQRLVERPRPSARSLFNHVIEIALAPSKASYIERWQGLLTQLFNPLYIENSVHNEQVLLSNDGQNLYIPAILHAPSVKLVLAEKGQRLFAPADVKIIIEIMDMLNYANENRQAYQEGARKERLRIGQDLHDDLGSILLTGLHQPQLEDVRDTINMGLVTMRSIVRGLAGKPIALTQLIAELREESYIRCESAGIELHWPLVDFNQSYLLEYFTYRHFLSLIRELITNIIRHAHASYLQIDMQLEGQVLQCKLYDDGDGFSGETQHKGHGLTNLNNRVALLGASLHFTSQSKGTLTYLTVPLNMTEAVEK